MGAFLNTAIMANPYNWVKVGLMMATFFVAVELIASHVTGTPSDS